MTVLFLVLSATNLSGCGPAIKANGGVAVARPYVPEPSTAMDSDVAVFMEQQDSALSQCNANFQQ